MQRAATTAVLLVLCCAACATEEKAPTDPRLVEAQKAFEEGQRLQEAGQYAEAVPLVEQAQKIREAVLTATHPQVADCLNLLGELQISLAGYAQAEPLLKQALQIREAAFGANHADVASSLNTLGNLYKAQELYTRAEPLFESALHMREALLGENHPDVATSLNDLATLYEEQGLYARAEPLYKRALKIFETVFGEDHLEVGDMLNNLAGLYHSQGLFALAEPMYERALKIGETSLGENHPDVATTLNNLGVLYSDQRLYARAVPSYERALKIRETALGEHHPLVASTLNNLGLAYKAQGFYARAEIAYQRALTIKENALGKEHSSVATSLDNLADLYSAQGFAARAEPLHERALRMREAIFGENHPAIADSLNNLAGVYFAQGFYGRAEPLYERSLKIKEASLGANHPAVAISLNNLAVLYSTQGLRARAETLYERALRIREAALGANNPDVAVSLNNLANLYVAQGFYARAEPLYERALKISETAFGESHPDVARMLNNLAFLYKVQGLYARAEPFYERVLKLSEAALGESDPAFAVYLHNIALFRLAQQRFDAALPLFQRAFASSEGHLRQEVFGFSEKRLVSFLHLFRARDERLYALARAYPDDPRVLHQALSAALLRKGRSVREIANTSYIIYRDLDQSDRETFDQLRAVRTQLSNLALAGPGNLSPAEYRQRLKELADKGDGIEAAVARRSESLRRLHLLPPPDELIARVAPSLPSHGALVEFVAYQDQPLVPKPGLPPAQVESHPRYLALILFADGHIRAVDLGPTEPIDRAAIDLHRALAEKRVTYRTATQALYKLAFRPLVPHLGKTQHLFIAPDGQMNLVPFAALHDGRRSLMDAFDITYLTSGKDLLPRTETPPSSHSMVVLADPDFDAPSRRSEGTDSPWPPLPGTRKEAEAIRGLFPRAQLLLGAEATKQTLLKVSMPGVLHIATHGFFLDDGSSVQGGRAVGTFGAVGAGPGAYPEDPLLRSGLVLAGARSRAATPGSRRLEDSLVTALELAGLNLWGTQLVVLSACDTGRGEVKRGEGVYGLRRAFLVAGAETLVTSLWKVNDEATKEFMEGYYRHMLAGGGRISALRETMKEMRRKHPHPYHWAAFTALGLDAPLQGR